MLFAEERVLNTNASPVAVIDELEWMRLRADRDLIGLTPSHRLTAILCCTLHRSVWHCTFVRSLRRNHGSRSCQLAGDFLTLHFTVGYNMNASRCSASHRWP